MKITPKDLIHQFTLPLWNEKTIDLVDTFVAPHAPIHTTLLTGHGPNTFKENAKQTFNAFSDLKIHITEFHYNQNEVIYKWSGSALHTGPILNVSPTLENINFSGITSNKLTNGLISELTSFSDMPRVLFQKQLNTIVLFDIKNVIQRLRDSTGKKMTKREIECLHLWVKGFSIKQSAEALGGLSNRTIQTFRENIKRKLNVSTYQKLLTLIQDAGLLPIFLNY